MNVLVTLGGALAFLAVLWAAATIAPKYMRNSKASGPDAGSGAAAGGSYGASGFDDCSGGGADGGCD